MRAGVGTSTHRRHVDGRHDRSRLRATQSPSASPRSCWSRPTPRPTHWATTCPRGATRADRPKLGFAEQFKLAVHFVFSPKAFRTIPDFIAGLEQRIADNPPDRAGLYEPARVLPGARRNRTALVVYSRSPTLGGDRKRRLPSPRAYRARELAALISGARYHEVPETSHGMVWEEPAALRSADR